MDVLTIDQLNAIGDNEGGFFKFIQVNGEFRFIKVTFAESHSDMLKRGEMATGAGAVMVFNHHWRFSGYGSRMLSIDCSEECGAALRAVIGRECRERSDYF